MSGLSYADLMRDPRLMEALIRRAHLERSAAIRAAFARLSRWLWRARSAPAVAVRSAPVHAPS